MKKTIIKTLVIFFIFIAIISIIYFMLYYYFTNNEIKTKLKKTSTNPVLYKTDEELLDQLSLDFPTLVEFLEKAAKESDNHKDYGMFPVPGLKATKSLSCEKSDMCTSMTPQGIAVYEKYIFISAYCGTHKHNSVIYVLDTNTKQFIKEIILDSKSHVGGLAFDEKHKNLWVSEFKNNKAFIAAIHEKDIEAYDSSSNKPIKYKYFVELEYLQRSSSLAYDNDGYIVSGYFKNIGDSYINFYKIKKNGIVSSTPTKSVDSGARIQGIAISDTFTVTSKSYGPYKSKLLFFDKEISLKKNNQYKEENAVLVIPLPEKLEQIYIYKDKLYMLFESGAFKYRFFGTDYIDRVITIDYSLK